MFQIETTVKDSPTFMTSAEPFKPRVHKQNSSGGWDPTDEYRKDSEGNVLWRVRVAIMAADGRMDTANVDLHGLGETAPEIPKMVPLQFEGLTIDLHGRLNATGVRAAGATFAKAGDAK